MKICEKLHCKNANVRRLKVIRATVNELYVHAHLHFWEHIVWPCCCFDLQMARAGNRVGKRNPGFPKSLSLFWTFVTAMHTDHNSRVFCEKTVL